MERLLKRVRASPWKNYGRASITVLVNGGGGDRGNDALALHCVHGNNEETHQDVLVCLVGTDLVVAATCPDGGRTWVVACALLEILGVDRSQT